jgi:hypothetical protein
MAGSRRWLAKHRVVLAALGLLLFAVGIFFAWAVGKTHGILGGGLAHGWTNVLSFLLMPFLALSSPSPSPDAPVPEAIAPAPTALAPTTIPPSPERAAGQQADPAQLLSVSSGAVPLRTVLDERFIDNRRGWPNDPSATAWLAGQSYHLFAREPGRFVAVGAPYDQPLRDVILTATFRKVGGPLGGGYGFLVRDEGPGPRDGKDQGGRYYVFEVGDRGEVGIWRRENDRWVDLVPWTPSDVVRRGSATNELAVRAVGQQLVLLVNGSMAASVEDAALARGAVGVFVGGDFNEVEVQRFLVQTPQE